MARLAKVHLQITGLATSNAAVVDGAIVSTGITDSGTITTTGSVEASGFLILTADNNKRVSYSAKHMGGTLYALESTEL